MTIPLNSVFGSMSVSKLLAILALPFAATVLAPAAAEQVKPVLLTTPSAFATSLPGSGSTIRWIGDRLGVNIYPLPANEILAALEKDIIDAAEFASPLVERGAGLHRLADDNYFPGWHQQASALELLINIESWNRMHDSQRALLDLICRAATANSSDPFFKKVRDDLAGFRARYEIWKTNAFLPREAQH